MKRTFSSSWPAPGRPVKRQKSKKASSLAVTTARKVNKILRSIEHKNLNVNLTDSNALFLQAAGTVLFGTTTQGDDDFERIGHKIHIEKFDFICHVGGVTAAAPPVQLLTNGLLRMVWVWDKAPDQALATYGDIFETNTAVAAYNEDNKKRFVVLYDQTRILNGFNENYNSGAIFKGTIKVDRDQIYDGVTNVIADVTQGALICASAYDVLGTLAGTPTCNMMFHETFTDL